MIDHAASAALVGVLSRGRLLMQRINCPSQSDRSVDDRDENLLGVRQMTCPARPPTLSTSKEQLGQLFYNQRGT
ncbi:MAG: hypothetical protein O3C40_34735 [Planctomycetota bacterium]|nr:hypothetical protein [Planctomycetota bacterium]